MTDEKTNFTGWVISIGANVNVKGNSALIIPIFILVAGNVGAYIRYLYGWIREKKIHPNEIEKLTELYLNHKKIVNSLCISSGLKYDDIREKKNVDVVKLKHMHNSFDENRDLLYFLPPISTAKLAEYFSHKFNILYEVEGKYEIMKAHLRSIIYEKTIDTISTFFLAPILAIVAWLLLVLGGTSGPNSWETFAVAAFAAGLASNAIIKRLWDFVGEKFDSQQEVGNKPKEEAKQNAKLETSKKGKEAITEEGE
jgi:hypothetical protein